MIKSFEQEENLLGSSVQGILATRNDSDLPEK